MAVGSAAKMAASKAGKRVAMLVVTKAALKAEPMDAEMVDSTALLTVVWWVVRSAAA